MAAGTKSMSNGCLEPLISASVRNRAARYHTIFHWGLWTESGHESRGPVITPDTNKVGARVRAHQHDLFTSFRNISYLKRFLLVCNWKVPTWWNAEHNSIITPSLWSHGVSLIRNVFPYAHAWQALFGYPYLILGILSWTSIIWHASTQSELYSIIVLACLKVRSIISTTVVQVPRQYVFAQLI